MIYNIEKIMDVIFKRKISTEDTKHGWLPDERRTLWAAIICLVVLQLYMAWYMKVTWTDEANQVLGQVNNIFGGGQGNTAYMVLNYTGQG